MFMPCSKLITSYKILCYPVRGW